MADYRSGARSTALPERIPQAWMIASAKAATPEELQQAAAYFSSLRPRRNLRVRESSTAPRLEVGNWILVRAGGGGSEPLGERIVELADDLERFELRDPRATFTAWVPPGSVKRGRALVRRPGTNTVPACAKCHGKDLGGTEAGPPLAGRSPSYLFRQLYELQAGVRNGPSAELMKPVLAGARVTWWCCGVDCTGQAGPDASGSGVLLEEDRHLCLRGAASRYAQDEFDQLTVRCVDLDAVQLQKDQGYRQGRALVAVQERVVLGEVEQVGRRHLDQRRVEEEAVEGRLRHLDGRAQEAEVTHPGAPSVALDLVRVHAQRVLERDELRLDHSASFLNTAA